MTIHDDNFIMLPINDFCFKELMQNPKVRKGFIAVLLNKKPEEIEETFLLPTILRQEQADDKLGILDVRVQIKNGTQIDLEMQVAYFAYWPERSLFYLGKMYTEQLKKGDPYAKLKKCIHVSILDFIQFPEVEACYSRFHFIEDITGVRYTDKLEIQVLELKKLPPGIRTGEGVTAWMRFLNGKRREEFEYMAKQNEYLDEAYNTLINLSADDQKKLEYEAREKALKDYNTQMGWARKEGLEKGLEKGLQKGLEKGRLETEARYARLADVLLETNQQDQLLRALTDQEYREQLYKKYEL